MNRWIVPLGLTTGLLVAACGGGETGSPTIPSETPPYGRTSVRPTQYDPDSSLLVKGRDRLRACVEVLDEGIGPDEAKMAIEVALIAASRDSRWDDEFGTPVVEAGCPLPPAALDVRTPAFFRRMICSGEVSPYLVYVFVGNESSFTERFPAALVDATAGLRMASQESISVGNARCYADVSEAWYLTPEDLGDEDLLLEYIFFRAMGR